MALQQEIGYRSRLSEYQIPHSTMARLAGELHKTLQSLLFPYRLRYTPSGRKAMELYPVEGLPTAKILEREGLWEIVVSQIMPDDKTLRDVTLAVFQQDTGDTNCVVFQFKEHERLVLDPSKIYTLVEQSQA